MSVGTVANVETLLGRDLDADETALATLLLNRAELMVKTRAGTLAELDQEVLAMVEEDSVCRVLRNPEGWSSQAADGYSASRNWQVASGLLTILPAEWNQLGVRQGWFALNATYTLATPAPYPWEQL